MIEKQHEENDQNTQPLLNNAGDRLKYIREEKHYSQKMFATYLKISQQILSRYEKGKTELPFHILNKLYNMDVSINWLLFGEEPMEISCIQESIEDLSKAEKKIKKLENENLTIHKEFTAKLSKLVDSLNELLNTKKQDK